MNKELSPFEIECITVAAYEAHRQYCLLMGDKSHVRWDELDSDLKRVAKQATVRVATHGATAEESHQAWVTAKKADGWTYGPTKNTATKEHPCLIAFAELPAEQQAKDILWTSVIKAMVSVGWRLPQ